MCDTATPYLTALASLWGALQGGCARSTGLVWLAHVPVRIRNAAERRAVQQVARNVKHTVLASLSGPSEDDVVMELSQETYSWTARGVDAELPDHAARGRVQQPPLAAHEEPLKMQNLRISSSVMPRSCQPLADGVEVGEHLLHQKPQQLRRSERLLHGLAGARVLPQERPKRLLLRLRFRSEWAGELLCGPECRGPP